VSESELQRLRERVAMLEDILGVGRTMISRLRTAFDLQPDHARILGMLLNRQLIAKEAIYNMLYGHRPECDQPIWKTIDVQIHKLRKRLRIHGIEFIGIVGEGYTMKPEHKLKVREHLGWYEGEGDAPAPNYSKAKAAERFGFATDFPTISIKPLSAA
jgi:hypothetical protein